MNHCRVLRICILRRMKPYRRGNCKLEDNCFKRTRHSIWPIDLYQTAFLYGLKLAHSDLPEAYSQFTESIWELLWFRTNINGYIFCLCSIAAQQYSTVQAVAKKYVNPLLCRNSNHDLPILNTHNLTRRRLFCAESVSLLWLTFICKKKLYNFIWK